MESVAILISSFDGFSDCWEPVCHGITKYWPECEYPIFLITNKKTFKYDKVNVIRLEEDKGWSANLIEALNQIEATYILYLQEDYWIREKVNSSTIYQYITLMEEQQINYLRLLAYPTPDFDYPNDKRLGVLATNASYRTALQLALWRKKVLLDLIEPSETPWQFELQGTIRSQKYTDSFLSIKKVDNDPYHYGIRYVCTAINRGRWARIAKEYAKAEGLQVNWSNLPSETWWHEFSRNNKLGVLANKLYYRANLVLHHPDIAMAKVRQRLSA